MRWTAKHPGRANYCDSFHKFAFGWKELQSAAPPLAAIPRKIDASISACMGYLHRGGRDQWIIKLLYLSSQYYSRGKLGEISFAESSTIFHIKDRHLMLERWVCLKNFTHIGSISCIFISTHKWKDGLPRTQFPNSSPCSVTKISISTQAL